jgi:hypothetical protein
MGSGPAVDIGDSSRVEIRLRPSHHGPPSGILAELGVDSRWQLDDPEHIAGLSEVERAALSRRNVFPFGMSVAAHRVLQMVGVVTGLERVGRIGPQMYHAYPGCMEVREGGCEDECEYRAVTASAQDLRAGLVA